MGAALKGLLGRLTTLHRRSYQLEILDRPGVDPRIVASSYRFMGFVNRWLGGTRVVHAHLGGRLRILDIGCGGGDIARSLAARGAFVVAVELSGAVLKHARRWTRTPRVRFVRADGRRLPFRDGAFDGACASMMFHHLREPDAAAVLAEMRRVAPRAVVNDLMRNRRAFLWAWLMGALFGDPAARVDGPRSIERSYTREEALAVARLAGVKARYVPHFGHRFALIAETRSGNRDAEKKADIGQSPDFSE